MKANWVLFVVLGVFFLLSDIAYTVWNVFFDPLQAEKDLWTRVEWVGTLGMLLSTILAFFLAFFIWIAQRGVGGTLPEDRLDAKIDDGDPELGHFSPWSWWPLVLAFGLALMFLGLAVGVWISIIGAPITLLGVIGWNYEYYRGNFAR